MSSDIRRLPRTYTIGQLCREFGTTPRALRFYEDKGLLEPGRNGPNRVYSYRDRARLQLVLRGKKVGLELNEIREILELYGRDEANAQQNAKALRLFKERIVAFEDRRKAIDDAIDTLKSACARLEADLAKARPDLLPQAEEYDRLVAGRVGGHVEYAFAR